MTNDLDESAAELAVLGVGSIAEAIVTGLCAAPTGRRIVLSPRGAARAARLAASHPNVRVATDNQAAVSAADTILLSLRVADTRAVLPTLTFGPQQRVISVMPSLTVADLRALIGDVAEIARAIPSVAVAERTGYTPLYPSGSVAQTLFDDLGASMVLGAEHQLDAASVASATVATYFAYLGTIADWLVGQGVDRSSAQRMVAAVFAGASADLAHSSDFATLAAQHATPGGQNEQLLASLRSAGLFDLVTDAMGDLIDD